VKDQVLYLERDSGEVVKLELQQAERADMDRRVVRAELDDRIGPGREPWRRAR